MSDLFVFITLVLSLTLTRTLADVSSLQDQDTNPEHLDPVNDQDQDLTNNSQDKRTICGAFNKCSVGSTAAHVRHVVVRPGIRHQLVGYAPIVRPVGIRPVVLGGYKYPKPKIHFRLRAASPYKPVFGGWSPVISSTKPAIQVVKPANHIDVVHTKPVPHVDHVHTNPGAVHVDHLHHNHVEAPLHLDHVHVQPGHVHVQPIAVQGAHVDQVHHVNIPHGNHYDTFTHVDHIHQPAVPVAQPAVPIAPPPTIVKPFVPPPVLFEVTRPNLGVLPLGARFSHPILREISHVHYKPAFPVAAIVPSAPPAISVASPVPVIPADHHHYRPAAGVPHQHVQGIIPAPVGLPHFIPQPGISVEYHGTRNYLPVHGAAPFLHQTPVNAVHPVHPTSFGVSAAYPHQQLPSEHAHHGFLSPQQLPHAHQPHGFISQQLPHEHQAQFSPEQQLPREISSHFFQNQVQATQPYQEIPQGQLPLEGEENFDQFFQSNQESFASNSLNVQSFNQNNVIQPGQTDVQIPYHLPQHPGWEGASAYQQQQQAGLQEESRGFGDQVFRPSPQLEPPYNQ